MLPRPHPNVIKMYTAFTDRMPILPDSYSLYPEALPSLNFCELAINEPKTLFIVMKRFNFILVFFFCFFFYCIALVDDYILISSTCFRPGSLDIYFLDIE